MTDNISADEADWLSTSPGAPASAGIEAHGGGDPVRRTWLVRAGLVVAGMAAGALVVSALHHGA